MNTFTIKEERSIREEEKTNSTLEMIEFMAIDEEGNRIWGATTEVHRNRWVKNAPFGEWFISYSSCGTNTYREKLPHVATINAAMEFLKKQEQGEVKQWKQ